VRRVGRRVGQLGQRVGLIFCVCERVAGAGWRWVRSAGLARGVALARGREGEGG